MVALDFLFLLLVFRNKLLQAVYPLIFELVVQVYGILKIIFFFSKKLLYLLVLLFDIVFQGHNLNFTIRQLVILVLRQPIWAVFRKYISVEVLQCGNVLLRPAALVVVADAPGIFDLG